MKKLLIIMGFCCLANTLAMAQDQSKPTIQHGLLDSHHAVIATVNNGTFYDKNNNIVIRINKDASIVDGNFNTIGYIVAGNEIQDKDHKTLGYFNRDASVSDAQHKQLGSIKYLEDNSFEDVNHNKIAFIVKTEPMWAVAYYFLVHF